MNASIADSNDILSSAAVTYPWNESKLRKEDQATSRAFAAKITVRYKNNLINGLGLRANKEADEHTLIRVPAANLIEQAKTANKNPRQEVGKHAIMKKYAKFGPARWQSEVGRRL